MLNICHLFIYLFVQYKYLMYNNNVVTTNEHNEKHVI